MPIQVPDDTYPTTNSRIAVDDTPKAACVWLIENSKGEQEVRPLRGSKLNRTLF